MTPPITGQISVTQKLHIQRCRMKIVRHGGLGMLVERTSVQLPEIKNFDFTAWKAEILVAIFRHWYQVVYVLTIYVCIYV
jgi:hypothetical protein